jgi:inner membrane protein
MEQQTSAFERFRHWVKTNATIKLLGIGFIILILLIPLSMVKELIYQRQYHYEDAKRDITKSWGQSQVLDGPILSIPYEETRIIENKLLQTTEEVKDRHVLHFLPNNLDITGEVSDVPLHRGIFEVTGYQTELNVIGNFQDIDSDKWADPSVEVLWDQAVLSMGITDLRGIDEEIVVDWNGNPLHFDSGIEVEGVNRIGVSTKFVMDPSTGAYPFSCKIALKGSNELCFVPAGKTTQVNLSSSWPDPKFFGEFLPDNRTVENGFTADWKILHLNRSIPQVFSELPGGFHHYNFGVNLYKPVDEYRKSERSAKYAIMFIALTFVTFFFIQIMNGVSIHSIQFLIVGLALVLFYVLLLSLSEHIGFGWSYLIAAVGVITQITLYVKGMMKKTKLTMAVFTTLVSMYGFIYLIIQLVDYSLLVGSVGLFLVLGVLMYLSRKIDWYGLKRENRNSDGVMLGAG